MSRSNHALAAHWSETHIARILLPIQDLIHHSSAGGSLLLLATLAALLCANIPALADPYERLLHSSIGITVGSFTLRESVLYWINDGLMAIFFLLVGLELKREVMVGELSDRRAATLPLVAALGGALVPALLYLGLNLGKSGQPGWAIPMATDIAFVLGCLVLLGNRVPFALKIFVTAVAIVDDLIAVLVIAFFYSTGLNLAALALGLALLGLLLAANLLGLRWIALYLGVGVLVWLAFLASGIHATLAGVLLALTIPARYRIDKPTFLAQARDILDQFEEGEDHPTPMLTDEHQQSAVIALEAACEQVQAPLQKLEHGLHGWVNFVILPIFAFANAGVALSLSGFSGANTSVVLGVVVGLLIGKPVGLLLASWLAIRSGLAQLPLGVTWAHMGGAAVLAGIGFTMSIFIATLGFGDGSDQLQAAKLAILLASLLAGTVGLTLLRRTAPAKLNQA